VPVKLSQRAVLLFSKSPSMVEAAHVGAPTMTDPPATTAPQVSKASRDAYMVATGQAPANPAEAAPADVQNGTAPPRSDQPAPAPRLESLPGESGGTGVGAEIITPSNNGAGAAPAPAANPPANPAGGGVSPGAGNGAPVPTAIPDNGGLKAVGPPVDTKALPAVDKPADAPTQVNDVQQAPAQVTTGTTSAAAANKKGDRGKYDADKESSSKHKKKKGLDKLNPF